MELFIEYLVRNGIDRKLSKEWVQSLHKKICPKGSILLNMGEHTQFIYFIIKGIVRGFYVDENGVEITKCFSKEKEWCCIYNMLRDQPSKYWIETLEECELVEIHVGQIKTLIEQIPAFQRLYTQLCSEAFIHSDERTIHFQKMTAKERYLLFVSEHPDLVERVKQEYIASYIGVTPASLSRIKRDL